MRLSLLALCITVFIVWPCQVTPLCLFNCGNQTASTALAIFGTPLLGNFWWQGSNVCSFTGEEEVTPFKLGETQFQTGNLFVNSKLLTQNSSYQSYSQSCHDYRNAHVCKTTVIEDGLKKTTVSGKRCCPGYERVFPGYGCEKKVPVSGLVETLQRLNLTYLASAVEKSKTEEVFAGKNVTVFAPTNEALSRSSSINEDIAHVVVFETGDEMHPVKDILLGTIVNGELNSWDVADKKVLDTLKANGQLVVNSGSQCCGQSFSVNCARVKKSDVQFTGGVIHVVDALVQPAPATVWDVLESSPKFNKFRSLASEETKTRLSDPKGKMTVFAFTDDAYDRLPEEVKKDVTDGNMCYKDLIKYHILRDPLCMNTLDHLAHLESVLGMFHPGCHVSCVPTDAGSNAKIHRDEKDQVLISNAPITQSNLVALNGIVHVVGEVVLPLEMQSPVENVGRWSPQMQTLLKNSPLMKKVEGKNYSVLIPPPYTVQDMESQDGEARDASLARYVMEGDLKGSEATLTNLAGQPLRITRSSPSLWVFESQPAFGRVNCIKVVTSKAVSCGGTVYRMTNPLPPYENNLLALLRKLPNVSQFVMLVEAAGYADLLSKTDASFTVMAFPDDKFDQIFDGKAKEDLLSNTLRLKQFVGNHIINGSYCCSDLTNGMFTIFDQRHYSTLANTQKTISGVDECCMRFGNSDIAQCNIGTAKNGVVHMLKVPEMAKKMSSLWKPFDFTFNSRPFDNIFGLF